ncbi:MAG: GNAT family N-acetyltransferase [Candidatus Aenigmarchaeota archaeon]|nr:GNAT family N-acetyltransferase [Candidatus Aenigmarchaeota archaeon]
MKVAPLSKRQEPGLNRLLREYWETRGMRYSAAYTRRYLREGHRIEILGDRFFVAVDGQEVIGCASVVFQEPEVAELRDLFVRPAWRNRGVANQLLLASVAACRTRKVRKVFALVFPEVADLYRAHGFREEGRLRSHFARGEDLLIVARFLRT